MNQNQIFDFTVDEVYDVLIEHDRQAKKKPQNTASKAQQYYELLDKKAIIKKVLEYSENNTQMSCLYNAIEQQLIDKKKIKKVLFDFENEEDEEYEEEEYFDEEEEEFDEEAASKVTYEEVDDDEEFYDEDKDPEANKLYMQSHEYDTNICSSVRKNWPQTRRY